jgi:hypothetical protein
MAKQAKQAPLLARTVVLASIMAQQASFLLKGGRKSERPHLLSSSRLGGVRSSRVIGDGHQLAAEEAEASEKKSGGSGSWGTTWVFYDRSVRL